MKTNGSKQDLRERILAAARTHFAQGVAPSLAEVAQVAGISRATLYRAFSSREELLHALAFEPERESRERLLEKALEMIGQEGLAALSMDALADAAGVSRATVYRLFAGKAALFREVVKTYAPFERIALLIEQVADQPPEEVMPQVAQIIVELFGRRAGLLRTLAFEVSSQQEDTGEAITFVLERGIGSLIGYLQQQMDKGRLRKIAPPVALQALLGPLMIHTLTRSLAERGLGFTLPVDEVAAQFVALWLRAMKPEDSSITEQQYEMSE
jgi:AcrR family transcriptional regulator